MGHAGGEVNGPALAIDGKGQSQRLQFDSGFVEDNPRATSTPHLPKRLVDAIKKAVSPDRSIMLGSCGYYDLKFHLEHEAGDAQSEEYQEQWKRNLQGLARMTGRTWYAFREKVSPSIVTGIPPKYLWIGSTPEGDLLYPPK